MIIVRHIHTRAGTCSSCNDPVAFKLTMVIPDTVGIISDVTFNKVVGYNMYDDVDDHRRCGQHPFGGSNRVLPEWRTQIVCSRPNSVGGG